jgi:hypothetical protein
LAKSDWAKLKKIKMSLAVSLGFSPSLDKMIKKKKGKVMEIKY